LTNGEAVPEREPAPPEKRTRTAARKPAAEPEPSPSPATPPAPPDEHAAAVAELETKMAESGISVEELNQLGVDYKWHGEDMDLSTPISKLSKQMLTALLKDWPGVISDVAEMRDKK
jgi:hypothetical protein